MTRQVKLRRPVASSRSTTSIGLDIGSSAVRAAELRIRGGPWELVRYGQVGLPRGAVVDGEIRVEADVVAALKRLWKETGFSKRHVVLGISGSRVVVRQAEVPKLPPAEMRSAMAFRIQDLVPLPASNVEFDFGPLPPRPDGATGSDQDQTIILAAAHGDVVTAHLDATSAAGLQVDAIDAVPLALLRAIGSKGSGVDPEVVVSVGADLSIVAVAQDGVPAFIRMIARGGGDMTMALSESTTQDWTRAEASKRQASGEWDDPGARAATVAELSRLVGEVRDTVTFFSSRPESTRPIGRVILAGGGSRTAGLADEIGRALQLPVEMLAVPSEQQLMGTGLDASAAANAAATAITPVGLALWPLAAPYGRLDLFPEHIRQQRRARSIQGALVGAFVLGVVVFGAAGYLRHEQVRNEQHAVVVENDTVTQLQAQAATYAKYTRLADEVVAARQTAVAALAGDINWVGLLGEIGRVKPKGVVVTSFTGSASATLSAVQGSAVTPGAPVGTVTIAAQFGNQIDEVSQWIVALEGIPGLADTWVSSVTKSASGAAATPGNFSSTAELTAAAQSARAAHLPDGGHP